MDPIDGLFREAAADRRRGAGEIERRLLDGLLRLRDEWSTEALAAGGARLTAGQPAMANLRNLQRSLAGPELESVADRLERRAAVLAALDERLAASAWPLIEASSRVLSLSRSSAVRAVLLGARRRGWCGEAVIFDGSPAGCGADQAGRLAGEIPTVRSQPDAIMPLWLAGAGTVVAVGADAVSPTRLLNAAGTALLLELAAARGVPSMVIADSGKDLPDRELDEILAAAPVAEEEGIGRRWPIFEAAPLDLVTHRVTE